MKLKLSKANVKLIKSVSDKPISEPSAIRDETLNQILEFGLGASINSAGVLEMNATTAALLNAVASVYDGDLNELAQILLGIGLTEILSNSIAGIGQEESTELVAAAFEEFALELGEDNHEV